ncbi:flagellar biosynthetic protein FliO [Luteimonas sp. RD2P54]|uniref:Flagellar biosynthetic protein FliO n=1 Tax=Luteimonas endophytica TaxID=3042023 RepID=A0ABT6J5C1_9GAMM|nr:flagellar biosynthetic protein FliO [Luteimonas endophytica]MDH5822032.1 flagellar biosynthetic protein FliO [Luteimonas endophytica]
MPLLLCCAAAAAAVADPVPAAPSAWRELLGIVVPLAFVIFALFLVWRLARRRYGLTGKDAPLSVLQILPVGPRERVVLLRTRAGKLFAIGVSAQSVNLVATLDQADLEGSGDPPAEPTQSRRH